MLLCLMLLGISVNASAIDLESTQDFTKNPWNMTIGTSTNGENVYPNITTGQKTNGCNIADKEWNGITFAGDKRCITSGYQTIADGEHNQTSGYPTIVHSTTYGDDNPHLYINRWNTLTMTAPDGYKFTKIVFHFIATSSTIYNGVKAYTSGGKTDNFVPVWKSAGTYTTAADGMSGTFDASAEPVQSTTVECHASTAMRISSIDFTLVSTGEAVETKYSVLQDESMVGGTVEADIRKATEGTEITLTPKAATGYEYKNAAVTVTNNTTGEAVEVVDNKFTMPASDVTVSTTFAAKYYSISVSVNTDDDHNPFGTASADMTTAKKGDVVTLTATPKEGYEFLVWSSDDVNQFNGNTFVMPASNVSVTAMFAKLRHAIHTTIIGNGTVSLPGVQDNKVSEGNSFRVVPTAADGYELASIVVADAVTGDIIEFNEEINAYVMPAHDVNITVTFKRPVVTFASLDELVDAELDNALVNVTIDDVVALAQVNPVSGAYMVMLQNSGVTLLAPASDLGWVTGGTVTGTLNGVDWDGMNYALYSEDESFWSGLTYTAPAGDKTTETVTIAAACTDGEKCYSTFSSKNAFYVPAELTVCEVKVEGDKLTLVPYQTGDLVAPYTGLLVSAAEGGEYEVEIEIDEEKLDDIVTLLGEENALRPTCIPGGITAEDMGDMDYGMDFYRLTMHNGTEFGFWWGAADGAAFDIVAGKAYLVADHAAAVKGFKFGADTTGIAGVSNKAESKTVYNLNGQRVNASYKGMVITNGRKNIRK